MSVEPSRSRGVRVADQLSVCLSVHPVYAGTQKTKVTGG